MARGELFLAAEPSSLDALQQAGTLGFHLVGRDNLKAVHSEFTFVNVTQDLVEMDGPLLAQQLQQVCLVTLYFAAAFVFVGI